MIQDELIICFGIAGVKRKDHNGKMCDAYDVKGMKNVNISLLTIYEVSHKSNNYQYCNKLSS